MHFMNSWKNIVMLLLLLVAAAGCKYFGEIIHNQPLA